MKKRRISTLIMVGSLLLAENSFSQASARDQDEDANSEESDSQISGGFEAPSLTIRLELAGSSGELGNKEDAKKAKAQWRKVCKLLGTSLKVGGGAWGSGGFSSFTCRDSRSSSKKMKEPWILNVKRIETDVEVSLIQNSRDGEDPIEYYRQRLPHSEDFMQFLEDEEFIDLVAFAVMDHLPFLMKIEAKKDGDVDSELRVRYPRIGGSRARKFVLVEPPKELTIYTMEYDGKTGLYSARVLGAAKLEKMEPADPETIRKNRGKRNANQGYAYYKLDTAGAKAANLGGVWAHNAQGRGRRSVELTKAVAAANAQLTESSKNGDLGSLLEGGYDLLTNALLDTAASGYIGVRYGKQILAGDPLLAKTSFFGLLTEIRGGPLGGLRIYYDVMPEAKAKEDDLETKIGWSRTIFGTSLGFDPGFLFDRVDVTPKIGMWTLSATLPTEKNEAGTTVSTSDFKFKKQFSFGIEAGLEWNSNFYLVRTWYGFDMALSLGKFGGSAVKSNRFGLDTFLNTGPRFSILGADLKTTLLMFVMYESIELSSPSANKSETGEISGITYDGGYAGLGLAISW